MNINYGLNIKTYNKKTDYIYQPVFDIETKSNIWDEDTYDVVATQEENGVLSCMEMKVKLCPVFTINEEAQGSFKGTGTKDDPYVWEAQ